MTLTAYHSSIESRPIEDSNHIYPPLESRNPKKMKNTLTEYTGPSWSSCIAFPKIGTVPSREAAKMSKAKTPRNFLVAPTSIPNVESQVRTKPNTHIIRWARRNRRTYGQLTSFRQLFVGSFILTWLYITQKCAPPNGRGYLQTKQRSCKPVSFSDWLANSVPKLTSQASDLCCLKQNQVLCG